ncbi:MAG TPA: DNA adenine methylase [Blastocatellia bacterium]|nr:DNA adenine methylase [Blastocatellia bacterium]
MNYIGSKYTLLPFLEKVFRSVCDGSEKVFCDIFAGTGAVSRHFKGLGLRVIANDIQHYAYALNKAYVEINHTPSFSTLRKEYKASFSMRSRKDGNTAQDILLFINSLPGVEGFITQNYSPVGGRMYYTKENAERADAIRQAIKTWKETKIISEREYFYLLCSLLEAIDRVANTASVYGAYLKHFKASARRSLQMRPLELKNHVNGCRALCRDANELISQIKCDVLYLDPPYNHRQYGANYHVLETIAAYDNPELKGVTGMRDYFRSSYCRRKSAHAAMEDLVRKARTKHIFVSYNDEGMMSLGEIREILSLRGKPRTFQIKYNRFKADNGREYKRNSTIEYVHYVKVERPASES